MKRRYRRGIGKSTGKGPKRPAVAEVAEGGAQQIEDRRSDMINDKECNHAEAIAKDFYGVVSEDNGGGWKSWGDLTDPQRAAFVRLAQQALPIIGRHALGDVRDYLGIKAAGKSSWWEKALYAAGAVIAGAILGGLGMSLSGCGHSVDVTPGRTEVCKDGSCLVLEPGHISYSQAQPETDVPPVVQSFKK